MQSTPLLIISLISLSNFPSVLLANNATNDSVFYSERNNSNKTEVEITQKEIHPEELGAVTAPMVSEEDSNREDVAYVFRSPENSPEARGSNDTSSSLTSEDKQIQATWGGDCVSLHWQRCSKIKFWGGTYYVSDKRDPDKQIEKYAELKCDGPDQVYYCLNNGWTVARCHLMCMGTLCNKDYLLKFDKVVKHEGQCQNPGG